MQPQSLLLPLLLLLQLVPSAFLAQAPLDALAEEVREVKEAVASVQASLITSVRLIQGTNNENCLCPAWLYSTLNQSAALRI